MEPSALSRWSPIYLGVWHVRRAFRAHGQRLRGRTLDVGCGGKPFAGRMPAAVTRHWGVDFNTGAPGIAGAIDAACDIERLPFAAASFDSALSTQALEHVPHPQRVIAEVARVLRPGGVFFLTAPQTWCLHQEPHDYFRYTCHGLRRMLEDAGFRVETIEPQGGITAVFAQMLAYNLAAITGGIPLLNLLGRGLGSLAQWSAMAIEGVIGPRMWWDTLGWTVVATLPEGP